MPTLKKLIEHVRERLDDKVEDYLFSDQLLADFFNEAEREACRRAYLIEEKNNPTFCRLLLLGGAPDYSLNKKILRIVTAEIGAYIESANLSWDAASKQLRDSGNGFVLSGFEEGQTIQVYGFSNASNRGTFTVSAVTNGAITVNETGVVDETAGPLVTVKSTMKPLTKVTREELESYNTLWENEHGEPSCYIEEKQGEFRPYPIPEKPYTVKMIINRLPESDMELSRMETVTPEIDYMYHFDLIDWVCHLAYQSHDADEGNAINEVKYEQRFAAKFGPRPSAIVERSRRKYPRSMVMRTPEFGYR